MKKNHCILFVFAITISAAMAQELPKEKKWSDNLGIGILKTELKNQNWKDDQTLLTDSKNHPMIELSFARKLSKTFYFTFGISFQHFSTFTQCEGVFQSDDLLTDLDGYKYHPYYDAHYKTDRSVSTMGMPIGLRLLAGRPGKTNLVLDAGLQPSFVFSSRIKTSGFYERKGLYPVYPYVNLYDLLEDVPRLDYKEYSMSEDNKLGTKGLLLNAYIAAGISAPISTTLDIYIKGYLITGLQDITDDVSKDQDYVNVMGEVSNYEKTTLFGEGIVVGILLR